MRHAPGPAARPSALASLLAGALLVLALPGLARAQSPAAADDPSLDGPLLTRSETLPGSPALSTPLQVWLPAAPSFARPVVLVVHGWGVGPALYTTLAQHLATRGFAAALVEQPDNLELDPAIWTANARAALDRLEAAAADPRSAVFGELDLSRTGIVGHSLGAATAVFAAATDPRIKAAVALAPGTHLLYRQQLLDRASEVTVPLLVEGASLDVICPPALLPIPVLEAAPAASRLYVEVAGGDHLNFSDTDSVEWLPGPFFWGVVTNIPGADQRAISRRYATAWLEQFLGVRADASGWTDGSAAARDQASGRLSRFES